MFHPCQVTFSIPGVFVGVEQIRFDLSLNLGQDTHVSVLLMAMLVCTAAKTHQRLGPLQTDPCWFYPAGCLVSELHRLGRGKGGYNNTLYQVEGSASSFNMFQTRLDLL